VSLAPPAHDRSQYATNDLAPQLRANGTGGALDGGLGDTLTIVAATAATQHVTETAEPAVAVVKTRNKATRATAQPASATSGRFLLATYDKSAGETGYAKRPDAILRSMLGIKWRELWALGFTQKTATEVLAGIAAGEIDPDAFVAETLDELDALKEQEAAETA